jgi:hypothetical protein
VERTGWMLRGLVGLLMLGVWDPGAVQQLLRGVVVFDCANSNYRKHAKGSVSVGLGVTRAQVASSFYSSWSRGSASPGAARAPRPGGRAGRPRSAGRADMIV